MIRTWYPAARIGEPAPYSRPDEQFQVRIAALLSEASGVEASKFPDPVHVLTHASAGAPFANGRWPVILFAHGLGGYLAQNTAELEELASQGFVVVSVAIKGGAITTPLPAGGSEPVDPAVLADVYGEGQTAGPHFAELLSAKDRPGRDAARAAYIAASPKTAAQGRRWIDQVVSAASALRGLPATDRLGAHLDLDHLGVMGMSFGGGVAVAACEQIATCRGSANLDGFVPGPFVGQPFHHPHLVFESDTATPANAWTVEVPGVQAWRVHVAGAQHLGFTDLIHLMPELPMLGTVKGPRVHEILVAWLVPFFDRTLRSGSARPLDAPAHFPEVTVAAVHP